MGIFDRFTHEPTHSEKLDFAYHTFTSVDADFVFPNKLPHADGLIVSLSILLHINLDWTDATGYVELLNFYKDILLYLLQVRPGENDPGFTEIFHKYRSEWGSSEMTVMNVRMYVVMNMIDHNFFLDNKTPVAEQLARKTSELVKEYGLDRKEKEAVELGFYFENITELAIYGKLFGGDKMVSWLRGDLYIDQYQKGYQLVEKGKYREAIAALNECLQVNPIGISARFELCECYMRLGDLDKVRKMLMDMSSYLVENRHIAKFYRRMGYLAVEEGNYLIAVACYVYSQSFEDNPHVAEELLYIKTVSGVSLRSGMDPATVLARYHLPVLTERTIEDIQPPQ